MKISIFLVLLISFFSCTLKEDNLGVGFSIDSTIYYNDTIYNNDGSIKEIIISPHQIDREQEMSYSYLLLVAFSYYRDYIPYNFKEYKSPEHLYYAIPDTLKNSQYTYYISKNNAQGYLDNFEPTVLKSFGISLSSYNDTAYISMVYPTSSADKVGLKRGDKIIAIDNFLLHGNLDVYNAVIKMDKSYNFVILKNSKLDTIKIAKEKIVIPSSYTDSICKDVGYVKLRTFMELDGELSQSTSNQFYNALKETEKYPVTIIDLRGNTGGYLSESYKCLNFILSKGDSIVKKDTWECDLTSSNYDGKIISTIQTVAEDGEYNSRKFVILVNGYSASASEVFLSGIKYNTTHKIVGTKTYGKGIGQGSFQSKNGGYAHITMFKLFMPNGTKYHQIGFVPDYEIEYFNDDFSDSQLNKAIEVAKETINTISLTKMQSTSIKNYNDFEVTPIKELNFPMAGFFDTIKF